MGVLQANVTAAQKLMDYVAKRRAQVILLATQVCFQNDNALWMRTNSAGQEQRGKDADQRMQRTVQQVSAHTVTCRCRRITWRACNRKWKKSLKSADKRISQQKNALEIRWYVCRLFLRRLQLNDVIFSDLAVYKGCQMSQTGQTIFSRIWYLQMC